MSSRDFLYSSILLNSAEQVEWALLHSLFELCAPVSQIEWLVWGTWMRFCSLVFKPWLDGHLYFYQRLKYRLLAIDRSV